MRRRCFEVARWRASASAPERAFTFLEQSRIRSGSALSAVLAILFVSSCGDGVTDPQVRPADPPPPPPPPQPGIAASLQISPQDLSFRALGDSAALTATVRDQNGAVMPNPSVVWVSSNPDVADVRDGMARALGNGEATIRATSGSASATASVRVEQVATRISVQPDSVFFVSLGDTLRLEPRLEDANGHAMAVPELTWSSGAEGVVTVDETGLLTAVGNGETEVSAAASDLRATVTVLVSQSIGAIEVSVDRLSFASLGDTARVAAIARDLNGNEANAAITWSSADTTVAAVDEGLVTSIGNGEAEIRAQAGEAAATVFVAVDQVVAALVLEPAKVMFTSLGDTTRLVATGLDALGSAVPDVGVSWVSTDSAVASVDRMGLVTAAGNGEAEIEASYEAWSARAIVAVGQEIDSVVVPLNSIDLRFPGDTVRIGARAYDAAGARIRAAAFEFLSSDAAVVTAGQDGLVTAVAAGEATVTVSLGDFTKVIPVRVTVDPMRIEITPDRIVFLHLHQYEEIRAVIRDGGGNRFDGEVQWRSTNPDVVRAPTRCGGTPGLEYPCARSIGEGTAALVVTAAGAETVVDSIPLTVAIAQRIRLPRRSHYTFDRPGAVFQIEAEVLSRDGTPIEHAPIKWSSTEPGVATVDSTGLVEVHGYGSTLITIRAGKVQASALIDVLSPVVSIRVEPDSLTLNGIGDSATIQLLGKTLHGGDEEVFLSGRWSSSDTKIVAVRGDAGGAVVTARGAGKAEIIAMYSEGDTDFADTATVLVDALSRITVSPSSLNFSSPGDSAQLEVEVLTQSGRRVPNPRVLWASADTSVATVDSTGIVVARDYGRTEIRVQVSNLSESVPVTVAPPPPPGMFRLDRSSTEPREGDTLAYVIVTDSAPPAPVRLNYSFRSLDGIPDVEDPDGEVLFPAGETSLSLSFPILDDTEIEPPRDTLVLTLREPLGGSVFLDTVLVREGVCDRADPVMRQILFWSGYRRFDNFLEPDVDRCGDPDDETLEGMRVIRILGPSTSADGAVRLDTLPMKTLEELQESGTLQLLGSRQEREKLTLRKGDFSGLTSLVDLWIIRYDMTDVNWEDELFADLPVLEQLLFVGNRVADIPASMFRGINAGGGPTAPTCPERSLYRDVQTGEPFCRMVSLSFSTLDLSGTIPSDLLDPMDGLRALQFGEMEIAEIPAGFLDDLPELVNVTLASLPLTSLDAGLFARNPNLFRLYMSGILKENNVALPNDFLGAQSELLVVWLEANGLTSIDGVFADSTTIRQLYLADNELSSLPAGFLGRVAPELQLLDLSNNQLRELPDGFFEGLAEPIQRLLLHGNPGPDGDTTTTDFSISSSIVRREVTSGQSTKLAVRVPAGSPVDVPFDLFVSSGYLGTPAEVDSLQGVLAGQLVVRAGRTVSDSITITRLDTIPYATTCVTFTEPPDDPCWTSPSETPNSKAEVVVRARSGVLEVSGLTLDGEFDPIALFTTDDPSIPFLRKPLPVIRVLKGGSYRPSSLHPEGKRIRNPNHLGEVRLYLSDFIGRTATSTDLGPEFDVVAISVDPFEEHTTFGSPTNPVLGNSPLPGIGQRTVADTMYEVDFNVEPPTVDTTIVTETRWVDECDPRITYADSVSVPTPFERVCGVLTIRPQHWEAGTYDVVIEGLEFSTGELLSTEVRIEVIEKDPSKFNIDIVDVNGAILGNAKMKTAIDYAVRRWGEVLSDVRDVRANVDLDVPLQFGCATVRHPPVYATAIDDLLIWVDAFHDDGPGGTLAAASVCGVRDATDARPGDRVGGFGLPVVGWFYFDLDDVDRLTQDQLNATVLHELGHTLGLGIPSKAIGTWYQQGECHDPESFLGSCYSPFGRTAYAPGPTAIAAFDAANGRDTEGRRLFFRRKVPLEPGGRSGVSGGHWEERALQYELMTPFISERADGAIPFSAITAGMLQDMGYRLQGTLSTSWPDQYCIPDINPFRGTLPCVDPAGDAPFTNLPMEERIRRGLVIDLTHDLVVGPVKLIDGNGRISSIFYPTNPIPFSTARRLQQLDLDDPDR